MKSIYDGLKMNINYEDDISDRILPHVKKAHEAYIRLKQLGGEKALTEAAVKLIKSKCIK